jgi:ABC-type Fe3+/spermidine/putrescine transport system ATPase subunit
MPTGQVKIRVDRASRIFLRAGVVAFEDLTLDLYENEIACVVGPSGCGKTTLLRCIDGLLPLSHGQILVDGGRSRARLKRWRWCFSISDCSRVGRSTPTRPTG